MGQHHIAGGLRWLAITYCACTFLLIANSIIAPLSEHLFAKADAAVAELSRGIANRDAALAQSAGDEAERITGQLRWIRLAGVLVVAFAFATMGCLIRATWLLAGVMSEKWSILSRAASLALPLLMVGLLLNGTDLTTKLLGQLAATVVTLAHERAVTSVAHLAGETSLRQALRGRYFLGYGLVFVGITAGLMLGAIGAAAWLVLLTISTIKFVGAILVIDMARLFRRLALAL